MTTLLFGTSWPRSVKRVEHDSKLRAKTLTEDTIFMEADEVAKKAAADDRG
jgi:hypothetical protein